jgi:hypothetical protein
MEMARRLAGSIPESRSENRRASMMEPRLGCEVKPLMASMAPSTASQPAATAASTLAAAMPEVSCVWKCTGISSSSFSAFTSVKAALGWHSPAMSLMPRMCVPASFSARPIFR